MKVAIVGSRDFQGQAVIAKAIVRLADQHPNLTVVSGGARGADSAGANVAVALRIPTIIHLPDWDRYGKSAGFRRNELIVADADMLLAFYADGPRSKGTTHSVDLARKKGIPVHIYHEGVWS
jgi:hypothetical protein